MLAFSGFFVGFFYVSTENFNTELASFESSDNNWLSSAHASQEERKQILDWVEKNEIVFPETGDKIRYLKSQYPDRPWLE